jgi:hypothetical protein
MISDDALITVVKEQISSDLAGEAVILNLKSGTYFGVNEVGAYIWNLIQQPKRFSQIRESILAEYEVTPENCEADLQGILQAFQAAGLIEVADEPHS